MTPPNAKPQGPDTQYVEGYRAGWLTGFADGKGAGYTDAKVRARFAIEAACDHLELSRNDRALIMRASDNILGEVQ
jgi:hypothetical protein